MPLVKYVFKAGVNKEGTNYSNENGWFDADKVRFRKGKPERIGGWTKNTEDSFIGTCRKIYPYKSVDGTNFTVLGTHQKLYIQQGEKLNDITPIRATTTNGIVFAATNGTYTFTATATANGSDTGNGGSGVDGAYQLNVGLDVYVESTGWGSGIWGAGTFGSSSSLSSANQLRLWSLDNFGDDAVANIRADGIFYWDKSSGASARATNISALANASNVPTIALQVMTSDVDRHVIAFGCNTIGSTALDPLLVRFSDTESIVDWTPTATNQAGGVQLSQGSVIVAAIKTRQEIIIFTDVGLVSMRFVGSPFVFSFTEVAEGFSLISPNSVVNADSKLFFMDRGGFYIYSGRVQRLPCTVLDYVLSDINYGQSYKIFGAVNSLANEIMWFYPSGNSLEVDKYVLYNYLENVWSIGTTTDNFVRTAWNEAHFSDFPIAASKNSSEVNINYLYNHEDGHGDEANAFTAYIESSDFDLQPDGDHFLQIQKLIPDIQFRNQSSTSDTVSFVIKGRNYPLESLSTLQTIDVTPNSTFSNTRARSRQCALRVTNSSSDYGWRLGDLRLDIRPDGKR